MTGGGVIHQRGQSGFPGPLPAPVINSGNRISPKRKAISGNKKPLPGWPEGACVPNKLELIDQVKRQQIGVVMTR